ncbi:MAG: TIGR02757 family protein [Spirochaetaceae bacterium]|nr:TIGR02757 family protein [Spirochaetaceae bacterium]
MVSRLRQLADRYECAAFMEHDPSRVLLRYRQVQDMEVAAFIAAMLAFGRRDLFLPKVEFLLELADRGGGPANWLASGLHRKTFPPPTAAPQDKFYRFYSYQDIHTLLCRMESLLRESGSLGEFFCRSYREHCASCSGTEGGETHLSELMGAAFADCKIVPKGKNSANKRVHMFLRWMVRRNSPVDVGLWSWYSPSKLLIPLDTHVLQQSVELGLLPQKAGGTARTAWLLTERLREVWPDDPCRGDFALFGLGVDAGDAPAECACKDGPSGL